MGVSKFSPELTKKICVLLRGGNYAETAAAAVGINPDTFYVWLRKGARGEKPYAAFHEAVQQALAEGEARDLNVIKKASAKFWQAAAWRLERRFPQKFGRRDALQVDAKIDVEPSDKLVEKLSRLIVAVEKGTDDSKPADDSDKPVGRGKARQPPKRKARKDPEGTDAEGA